MFKFIVTLILVLLVSACSDDAKSAKKSTNSGMKCGAGKCGANMFDGKSALAKKKKNILRQMRKDDPRKECVIKAKNTKEVYDCVRSPKTHRMSLKCGTNMQDKTTMKCGAGKCGN